MGRSWWVRFGVVVLAVIWSTIYVIPTVGRLDLEKTNFPFKQKINLGLDLQGGLYMVLGVDFNKVFKDVVLRQGASLVSELKDEGITIKSSGVVTQSVSSAVETASAVVGADAAQDPLYFVEFDAAKRDAVYDLMKKRFWTLRLAGESEGRFELGLSREYRLETREKTIGQSIEVIRNRIDEFGVSEPVIASQGADRIVVELPGVKDVNRAKDLIGRTAKLEFKIVNDEGMEAGKVRELVAQAENEKGISYKEGDKFSNYVRAINEALVGKIPVDSEIAFDRLDGRVAAESGETGVYIPYLLFSKAELTGEELEDAQVSFDQENRTPIVSFQMNPRGADLFDRVTGEHIQDRMAIVLDGIVHSAPVIQSRISGGRGQITLGAGNSERQMAEAKDLAIVLRAGALPAQLDFLEQRVTGPSLGQDSIRKGAMASLVGSLLVFAFILFYYRLSGAIAVLSLVLNVMFVLACLVGLEATLTLPGIAGIALTVGIAVDSNVVIYERIREELRAGRGAASSVEAGFQKAFRTILDANVTNAAAAIVLMMYGTGPIKGFAVTMLIGIVTTLFTAVFVCKVMFDAYLKRLEKNPSAALSI